ncbi:MAG: hypothetical protein MUC76_04815, partial [Spirochaetes bacterium]|nr:hypothetical protein [Spirochaetota bacterium]
MRYTMPSRILANLLLPGIEAHIDSRIAALSPLVMMDPHDPSAAPVFTMMISSGRRRLSIILSSGGLPDKTSKKIADRAAQFGQDVSMLLCIAFGMPVTVRVLKAVADPLPGTSFIIDLSIVDGGFLRLVIPVEFFHLFLPVKLSGEDPLSIEEAIIAFFMEPRACFPRLGTLIDCLPPLELEALFHALRVRGHLSAYQVLLLLSAFPEYAERIRTALPLALVREGLDIAAARSLRITRRDLAGGVYSVEEALHHLIMSADPPVYFTPFRGVRALILDLRLGRSLPDGELWSLCENAASGGTLYEALGLCGERTAGIALAGAPPSCFKALRSCVSGRTADAVASLGGGAVFGATELSEARERFAAAVRKAAVRRLSSKRTDVAVLLSSLAAPRDFDLLLVDAGWYRIATALKGVGGEVRNRVLAGIAQSARFLIEDVLSRTINPDILHDELQVREAGDELADRILALYERGVIRLSGQYR